MLKDGFAGCTPAVRHCRGRRPRRPAGQAALCWLCVGRPAHRPPRTSAIAGKFAVRRPTYKPQKGRPRFPVAVMLQFFCASHKKIPHRPEQRTVRAKRNKQTAKKGAEQNAKTEAQPVIGRNRTREANSRLTVRGWLWLVDANHEYTLPYCSSDVKYFPKIIPSIFVEITLWCRPWVHRDNRAHAKAAPRFRPPPPWVRARRPAGTGYRGSAT